MPIDSSNFRRTLGSFASGVTVVTSQDPETDTLVGVTVTAFSSVSMDPPLVMFCLNTRSTSLAAIKANGHFAVNFLAQDQVALSNRFASKDLDKWSDVAYQSGLAKIPVLDGVAAHLECKITQAVDAGDHVIFIGQVEATNVDDNAQPLLYFRGAYTELKGNQ